MECANSKSLGPSPHFPAGLLFVKRLWMKRTAVPLLQFLVFRMLVIGDRVDKFVETSYAAAVFGRTSPLAIDTARITGFRFSRTDFLQFNLVFPTVAEVVQVLATEFLMAAD